MRVPNRTKIVATVGPASNSPELLAQLIAVGVEVFRINCAHADRSGLARNIRAIRSAARKLNSVVGVLVDLEGPKIRVGPLANAEPIWLKRGEQLVMSTEPGLIGSAGGDGEIARIGTSYRGLARDVKRGERVLLDDGNIELRVTEVAGRDITTTVVYGGLLKQYKGINIPGSSVSANALSTKDRADMRSAVEAGADFIALSFVRTANEIQRLRRAIHKVGGEAAVIAKIERPEAVDNLDSILEAADGVMIARGDMGVELGPEAVPSIQKRIIRAAVAVKKPVITATQMLESMITNPRPTRAEASDVANAIYDGSSAVMLSAETASGRHPVRAARIMDQIVRRTEADMVSQWEYQRRRRRREDDASSVTEATVKAAAYAAVEVGARAIAVFTESGTTAQLMAGERTPIRIVAFTPFQAVLQKLSLVWGVTGMRATRTRTSHEMTLEGERLLVERGLARPGDNIVVVFGTSRARGMTNTMNIRTLS